MLYIASDHAGYKLKEDLKKFLRNQKIQFYDLGTKSEKPVDYPQFAFKTTKKVILNPKNKGILICGSGSGMCIAANRIKGIRAALVYDEYTAIRSRLDNNANIICLRSRRTSKIKAKKLLKIWLKTKFSRANRHKRRIKKLDIKW